MFSNDSGAGRSPTSDVAPAEEAGLYRDYQGQRYWVCCAACGPLFDADPDRYANAA